MSHILIRGKHRSLNGCAKTLRQRSVRVPHPYNKRNVIKRTLTWKRRSTRRPWKLNASSRTLCSWSSNQEPLPHLTSGVTKCSVVSEMSSIVRKQCPEQRNRGHDHHYRLKIEGKPVPEKNPRTGSHP